MGEFIDLIITDQEYADKGMTSLSGTKWTNQAEMLKAKLDEDGTFVGKRLEQALLLLESEAAAENIGANVPRVADKNVQAILSAHDESIGNMYTTTQIDAVVSTNTNDLINSIAFNSQDGKFTIIKKDGTSQTIDTLLEKVPVSMEFETVGEVTKIILTNSDGSTSTADISTLVDNYTYVTTPTISILETGEANQREIEASVRNNSITVEHLSVAAVTQLEGYRDAASTSATSATNSAATASAHATTASTAAANAATSASTATYALTNVQDLERTAETFADSAENSKTQAKSYAMGGTGTRTGEDTDNAKYYAQQAQEHASAVTSFNGRTGTIVPQAGDYTAEQITTDPTRRFVTDAQIANYEAKPDMSDVVALQKLEYHFYIQPADWEGTEAPYTFKKQFNDLKPKDNPHITLDYEPAIPDATFIRGVAQYNKIDKGMTYIDGLPPEYPPLPEDMLHPYWYIGEKNGNVRLTNYDTVVKNTSSDLPNVLKADGDVKFAQSYWDLVDDEWEFDRHFSWDNIFGDTPLASSHDIVYRSSGLIWNAAAATVLELKCFKEKPDFVLGLTMEVYR